MSLEKTFTKRIIATFLPPWTERVGYPPSRPELAVLFPDRTSPIPLDLAPSSSLDGIYLDGDDAARDSRQLTGQLETLSPGGIAVMILSKQYWTKRDLKQACDGTGFRILFSSPIQSGQKVKISSEGLPVPASWYQRIFRSGRLAAFPALSFPGGKGLFVVLQKKFSQSLSSRIGLSVVMLMPENREAAARMLLRWDSFLKEKKFDDAQLVYVEDSHLDPPPLNLQADAVRKVDHYRPTGPYGAFRSGLAFSRGRKVIVDFSRGTVDPSLCMPLLDRFVQEEKNMGKRHFAVQGVDYRMRNPYGWLRGFFLRFVAGTVYPDSPLRIYPSWTASLLADLHPEEVEKYPLLMSMIVKKNGGRFINEKLNIAGVKNALKLSIPGMLLSYLRLRAGKLLGLLLISLLALSTLPHLQKGMIQFQMSLGNPNTSLEWILAGSALILSLNGTMDSRSGTGAMFHRYLQSRVPAWKANLNRFRQSIASSWVLRNGLLFLQAFIVSIGFYVASALLLFRRPGRGRWILLTYFLHILAMVHLLVFNDSLPLQTEHWEKGLSSLNSIIVQLLSPKSVPPILLWILGSLQIGTALIVIRLFRRKNL